MVHGIWQYFAIMIDETENGKIIGNISETKTWSFEKFNKWQNSKLQSVMKEGAALVTLRE